mmetsp:Transcript_12518/g.38243  ORF Transcript_12518/g.38243 Transcript_12518/m.38243 type:complete len:242 (-) Transcript_12518:405-1130(-)
MAEGSGSAAINSGWIRILPRSSALRPGERAIVTGGKSGKQIIVLRTPDGEYHAMDSLCYHMGAELGSGELIEIEEVGCWALKCPWHQKLVHVGTGEIFDRQGTSCTSQGLQQRVHEVKEDINGDILVRMNASSPGSLSSDLYNFKSQQGGRMQASLGFQARKRRATEAVSAKLAANQMFPSTQQIVTKRTVPSGGPCGAETYRAAPPVSTSLNSSLRQTKITAMFDNMSSTPRDVNMMETD